jgi:uncharacterized membrane protein YedE/YeeE
MRRMSVLLFLLAPQMLWAALSYPGASWSPYLVGAGIGVLSWLTFAFSGKPIGASSSYAAIAGLIGKAIAPKHTESLQYYKKNPPKIGWEVAFVGAAIVGAFISAYTGGEITNQWLHPMWVARFGDSIALRGVVAALGGALMAFGARLAGGCTSGHGISGALQLNPGSWITVICMFIGGIATAFLMYRI